MSRRLPSKYKKEAWQYQHPTYNEHSPCSCCYRPKVQSLGLVLFGFTLHVLFTSCWNWWVGVPGCNDASTRELLWFFDRVYAKDFFRGFDHPNSIPPVPTTSIVPTWRSMHPTNSVLDQPAAKVFGHGLAFAIKEDLAQLYKGFAALGMDVSQNQGNAKKDEAVNERDDGGGGSGGVGGGVDDGGVGGDNGQEQGSTNRIPSTGTLRPIQRYVDAVGAMQFQHEGGGGGGIISGGGIRQGRSSTRPGWGTASVPDDGRVSASTVLDTVVHSTNTIVNQLKLLNTGLQRLNDHPTHPKEHTVAYAGGGITLPDRFTETVDKLAIVLTWVNGSDPTTQQRRKERCFQYYGGSVRLLKKERNADDVMPCIYSSSPPLFNTFLLIFTEIVIFIVTHLSVA